MHTTPTASSVIHRWTRRLPYVVALGIALSGLAGYVAVKRPLLLGAQQVSAAPAMQPRPRATISGRSARRSRSLDASRGECWMATLDSRYVAPPSGTGPRRC